MTYVLPRPATASTTCRWSAHLTIWAFRVLLLDVRVQGWITKIGLRTVAAFKIAAFDIILGSTLALTTGIVIVAAVIVAVVVRTIGWLRPALHSLLHLSLVVVHGANHVWHSWVTCRKLSTACLSMVHHVLTSWAVMHVSHL